MQQQKPVTHHFKQGIQGLAIGETHPRKIHLPPGTSGKKTTVIIQWPMQITLFFLYAGDEREPYVH